MNEQRRQAYLNLIQALLECPNGQEMALLQENRALVDADLVQVIAQLANWAESDGQQEVAEILQHLATMVETLMETPSPTTATVNPDPADRPQAYWNLIQQLLNCPNGEEPQILQDNAELLDRGFLQACEAVAQMMAQQGQENGAEFLRNLAAQLATMIGKKNNSPQEYKSFLQALVQAKLESRGNPQPVYAILRDNLDKLDEEFARVLVNFANAVLNDADAERREGSAALIENLCLDISEFPLGRRSNNIEIAIAGYEIVLRSRENNREKWAQTQNNLANAYSDRILGEKAENIEQAIAYYQAALEVYTREAFPEKWAMTQNNLAAAYYSRIKKERADNIEQAIACYQAALEVYTRPAFPEQWAGIQNNLATAYYSRIKKEKADNKERADNIEQAIACYKAALEVYTREAFPEKWAMIQNNLGEAYRLRILEERADNIEQAIAYYQAALEVYTREAFPEKWAMTQNNLANAYRNRILEEKAENIEQAIACYQAALEVYTRQAFPEDWAMTQNNLAAAYYSRILGERAQNIERAIKYYKEALEVRTRQAFPQNHIETQFNLGLAYREAGKLLDARNAFVAAIDTVEFLRGEIASGEEAKQKLAEEWNKLYRNMVEVCLEMGNHAEAIEYVERSKSRNLVELLATRDLYPKGEMPEVVRNQLQRLRQEIDIEKRRLAADDTPNYSHLNQLRQEYNQLYPYEPIQFEQIKALLDDDTAIIQWYISGGCFRAFTITSDSQQPLIWKSSTEDLTKLVDWTYEYLLIYNELKIALVRMKQAELALKQEQDEAERVKCQEKLSEAEAKFKELQQQWDAGMVDRLQQLAEILHIDEILSHLPETCERLILIPHLFLHLLPLHALPTSVNGNRKCIIDCFQSVSYAPSCQLLAQVKKSDRQKFQHLIGIQNPTEDLICADMEVETIQETFSQRKILSGADAKKSALLILDESTQKIQLWKELFSSHCLHFSCHGFFNIESPLDSGLSLADGILTLAEILEHFDLKQCSLVTLSACETGLTDFNNISDEYYSLSAAFMMAGSPSVVVSLWSVNQFSTALLLINFYEELADRPGKIAASLNKAQRWLRDTKVRGFLDWAEGSQTLSRLWRVRLRNELTKMGEDKQMGWDANPFQSPYHWAGFCAVGQGEQ